MFEKFTYLKFFIVVEMILLQFFNYFMKYFLELYREVKYFITYFI